MSQEWYQRQFRCNVTLCTVPKVLPLREKQIFPYDMAYSGYTRVLQVYLFCRRRN